MKKRTKMLWIRPNRIIIEEKEEQGRGEEIRTA